MAHDFVDQGAATGEIGAATGRQACSGSDATHVSRSKAADVGTRRARRLADALAKTLSDPI